jgi:hypothetical protein
MQSTRSHRTFAIFIALLTISVLAMDDTGAQLFFRLVAAAYEHRALGVASHWPFEEWGRFLPEHNTAVSLLDRLVHHGVVVVHERRVVPDERSSNERRSVLVKEEVRILRGVETSPGHQQGLETGHCPFPPATCNLVKNDACGESVCLAEQLECPLHLLLTGLAGGGDE